MIHAAHIMERFPVENLTIGRSYGNALGKPTPYFHFKGRLSELMPLLREAFKTDPTAFVNFADESPSWVNLRNGETMQSMLDGLKCETALKAFLAEETRLNTPLTRDRPQLSVIGSSFSMGRVMQGHPVQCFRRPKRKLPPKTVELAINVSANVQAEKISASMAKIVHAAHEYHLAGGAISLVVHYLAGFRTANPETGAMGLCISLEIPLGDGAQASFAGSAQFLRGIHYPFAQTLSGTWHDGLPVTKFTDSSIAQINGQISDADAQLASLKIQ